MSWRSVFTKDRSLYLNLPKGVVDDAGLKAGDRVHVRYVQGIGIVVSFPVKIPKFGGRVDLQYRLGLKKRGKQPLSMDGETFDVIPLFDGVRYPKQK